MFLFPLGVGILFLALGVIVWRLRDDGRITRWEDLEKLPEAGLYYPGSTVLNRSGYDYDKGLLGVLNANYSQVLGVGASEDEVIAFYEQELARRGWALTSEGSRCTGTNSPPGRAWRNGQLLLKIGACDPRDMPPEYAQYRTIYRINIFASPLRPTATIGR